MQNFQGTFETLKQLFISTFSTCMTVPLKIKFIFTGKPEYYSGCTDELILC